MNKNVQEIEDFEWQ